MAISRMDMERQLRAGGGIMQLEEPRQGYFLGKIVKKITKPIKKIVKSPLGKAALTGAMMFGMPGTQFGGLLGRAKLGGAASGIFGNTGGIGALLGRGGKFSTLGDIFRVGGESKADFSVPRILGGLAATGAIAAPFFMGGDEEEVDVGTPYTMAQPMIEDVRSQAKAYYSDPTKSALYFMPPKAAVQSSFYAADGGLADIPREGYRIGGGVMSMLGKAGDAMRNVTKNVVTRLSRMTDDVEIQTATDYADDTGVSLDIFITPKSKKGKNTLDSLVEEGIMTVDESGTYMPKFGYEDDAVMGMEKLKTSGLLQEGDKFKRFDEGAGIGEYDMPYGGYEQLVETFGRQKKAEGGLTDIPREGYESGERVTGILKLLSRLTPFGAAKELGSNMDMDTLKKLSMFTPMGAAKKAGESIAGMDMDILKRLSMFTPSGAAFQLGKTLAMKDGGMIDMGGLEKDYREGGFVPLGAEERADDVPARLSKNEFVFTADAVRNAGGGDIDKGAEVMQNMMDNLESGGSISEESQGMENPAQSMFDQAQMLESRIE